MGKPVFLSTAFVISNRESVDTTIRYNDESARYCPGQMLKTMRVQKLRCSRWELTASHNRKQKIVGPGRYRREIVQVGTSQELRIIPDL